MSGYELTVDLRTGERGSWDRFQNFKGPNAHERARDVCRRWVRRGIAGRIRLHGTQTVLERFNP